MNILITGKNGFIAKNLIRKLENTHKVTSISHDDTDEYLDKCCSECDVIYHLAAVQRSNNEEDFISGNVLYTKKIIKILEKNQKYVPIVFTSSILVDKDKNSIFSRSKIEAEKILRAYGDKYHKNIIVFKLNNVFGEYGKPNFNNVVATFCYNIANSKPLQVNNPGVILPFTYIGDLMNDFENVLKKINVYNMTYSNYVKPSIVEFKTLGEIVKILGDAINEKKVFDSFSQKIYRTLYFYYG